jgi:RimJ/RimL family protein N-acetyltransferase
MKRVKANIPGKVFNLFAVRIANFKRRMENCGLTLRLYRLGDLPMLRSLFTPEIFLETSGFGLKVSSLLGFYKWLKATFQMVYIIEVEENSGHKTVGFAGLYNMRIGRSLWLSLSIFNPKDRRRGYGEQVLRLLLDLLQENGAAETVYAEVLKTNVPSLCLLRKLGFEVCGPLSLPLSPLGGGMEQGKLPILILAKSLG